MGYLLNLIYAAAILITLPFWIFKAVTTGKYRQGLWRKFCGLPPAIEPGKPVVWFHAVSVGEVLLLRPLLERLAAERPDLQPVLSTTTNTGFQLARDKYPSIPVFYYPLDFTWAVGRVLDALRPTLLVLVELELWPNLLLQARKRRVPVTVINTRLSERSFRGYQRIRSLLRPALQAVVWWGAQTESYAERLRQLTGSDDTAIDVTGSMKYDGVSTERDNPKTRQLAATLGVTEHKHELLWVAGSTMWPEEQIVMDVFEQLRPSHPNLRLVLVPRHQERFDSVAQYLTERGVQFQRRSQLQPGDRPAVLLVDTIGELSALWGLADFGFVGGSVNCGRGGQSMIEPAGFGVPLCFGPDTRNFRHTVENLLSQSAARQVADGDELLKTLQQWLADPDSACKMGQRAQRFVLSQQGAVEATFAGLMKLLPVSRDQQDGDHRRERSRPAA